MTVKEQKASEYFAKRYSCAQAVFAAFHEEMGLEEEFALKLMMPMGGGVSGLHETCGAFTGAAMALGMLRDVKPGDREAKQGIYDTVQEKAAAFKAQYGTVVCAELLAQDEAEAAAACARGEAPVDRPCAKYVRACAGLVEKELQKG